MILNAFAYQTCNWSDYSKVVSLSNSDTRFITSKYNFKYETNTQKVVRIINEEFISHIAAPAFAFTWAVNRIVISITSSLPILVAGVSTADKKLLISGAQKFKSEIILAITLVGLGILGIFSPRKAVSYAISDTFKKFENHTLVEPLNLPYFQRRLVAPIKGTCLAIQNLSGIILMAVVFPFNKFTTNWDTVRIRSSQVVKNIKLGIGSIFSDKYASQLNVNDPKQYA